MPQGYTKQSRRKYLTENFEEWDKLRLSYRDIALKVQKRFKLDRSPSPATIGRDWRDIREGDPFPERTKKAARLQDPESFEEWRAEMFVAPGGRPYETPKHQLALFWVIICLTLKWEMPDWVIEFFDLPEDVNDLLDKEIMLTFILLFAPRHGKSMLFMHAIVWLMIHDPNIRILYCQGLKKTSQAMGNYLRSEMEHNQKLVDWYGPFKDESKQWSRDGFSVARRTIAGAAPNFQPIGVGSTIRSLDADVIFVDDPEDEKRCRNPDNVEADYDWVRSELMTRREPHTPVLGVGSHVVSMFGDLWVLIEDNIDSLQYEEAQMVILRKIQAHNVEKCRGAPHKACLIWPEKRSWQFLMAQKSMLGDQQYEAVYQQVGRVPGTRAFMPEVVEGLYVQVEIPDDRTERPAPKPPEGETLGILDMERSWKDNPKCCGPVRKVIGFDPASGETRKASQSALHVLAGCQKCRRLFLIDRWAQRQSPERNADTIASFAKAHKVRWVRIETNAYQKSLARDAVLKDHARKVGFLIEEWRTDDRKNSPEFGIPNLARFMTDGMYSVPYKTPQDRIYARPYLDSLKRFPLKPSDEPMADWLALLEIEKVWAYGGELTPEPVDDHNHAPQYLEDQAIEIDLGDLEGWDELE